MRMYLFNDESIKVKEYRKYLWLINLLVSLCLLIFKIFIIIYFNVKNNSMPFKISNELYLDLEVYIVENENW